MKDYLDELRRLLEDRGYEDIDDTLSYFEEMMEDRIDSGESEEEILEEMASPEEVAEELCRDIPQKKEEEKGKGRKVFPDAEIREITVNVISYSVELIPVNGADCIVEYDQSRFLDLDVSFDGRTLDISQHRVLISFFNLGKAEKGNIRIYAPGEMIRELEVNTASGDVSVSDMSFHDTDIETVSGDICLKNVFSEDCSIQTVSGDLSADGLESRDLSISAVSGDATQRHLVAREIDISTVSGDVELLIEGSKEEYDIDISKLRGSESYEGRGNKELNVSAVSGRVRYSFTE